MANEATNTTENNVQQYVANCLFGRYTIYTNLDDLNEDNVVSEINSALPIHIQNLMAEEYLYWYRRGVQPILNRTKERNAFINNRIIENHAEEIVTFKNGYFLTQPAFYIARRRVAQSKINKLNEYLYRSGKIQADNEIVDWFHTVGKAALMVEPNNDPEEPVRAYALDPRSAFVVYSTRPGNRPVYAVNMVTRENDVSIDVFTRTKLFRIRGSARGRLPMIDPNSVATAINVEAVEPNVLGQIPIIEYQYNSVNMGAFEAVVPLLDAINNMRSNQLDGLEQFIQNLMVLYNCELPDDESVSTLKQKGLLILKSFADNKADVKILSESLNQTDTQVMVNSFYEQVLTICAMPSTRKGGTSTSDTGAAVELRDGWAQATNSARNTEDLYKKSNKYFDEIFTEILRRKGLLDINVADFEIHFVRNETANIQSKAQAFQTLMSAGLEPTLALAKSGVSNDPVADYKMSEKYIKMIWGDPDVKVAAEEAGVDNGQGEAKIIEEDRFTGDNETGGAE